MRTRHYAALLAVVAFVFVNSNPLAAQSAFSTGDGTGSVTTREGGFLQLEFAKETFRIGYADEIDGAVDRILDNPALRNVRPRLIPRWGIEFRGKPSDKTASLLRSSDLSVGAKGTLSLGVSNVLTHRPSQADIESSVEHIGVLQGEIAVLEANVTKAGDDLEKARRSNAAAADIATAERNLRVSRERLTERRRSLVNARPDPGPGRMTFDWLTLRMSYERSQHSLVDASAAFVDQISTQDFNGWGALLSYNLEFEGPSVLGLSFGVEKRNNVGALRSVDIRDLMSTSTDGSSVRTIEVMRKALSGEYKESVETTLSTDYIVLPRFLDSRIAVDLFTRTNFSETSNDFRPGIGIFLTQDRAPTRVIGGISFYEDREENLAVDLVLGFNF
jgi:hypothetical protein